MIVKMRKTAQGTEYWDTENKRTIFVPKGMKPWFEVAKDINPEPKNGNKDLVKMNKEQLLAFAKEHDIEIPGTVSKEETIRKYIEEAMAVDE